MELPNELNLLLLLSAPRLGKSRSRNQICIPGPPAALNEDAQLMQALPIQLLITGRECYQAKPECPSRQKLQQVVKLLQANRF